MVEVRAKVAGKARETLDKQVMCVGHLALAEEVPPTPATPPPLQTSSSQIPEGTYRRGKAGR